MVRLLPGLLPHAALSEADIGYSSQDALFRAGHPVKWRHFWQVVSVLPLDEQLYRDYHLFVHRRHEVVMLDGEAIILTRNQYCLLVLLLEHAGEVVPRAIVSKIFGFETRTRMVKSHISRLRRRQRIYRDHTSKPSLGRISLTAHTGALGLMRRTARHKAARVQHQCVVPRQRF